MQHLEGSGTPVLYIGRTVLKGKLLHLVGINSFECIKMHGLTNPKWTFP